jgi:hypothetical protein
MESQFTDAQDALSRFDVQSLLSIWKRSTTSTTGKEIRDYILENLKEVADHYGITLTEEDTFRNFISDWDEYVYGTTCRSVPTVCGKHFAKEGNLPLVKIAIKKGADTEEIVITAAKYGYLNIVKLLADGVEQWHRLLYQAARYEHREIIDFILEQSGAKYLVWGLRGSARKGDWDLVHFFTEKMALNELEIDWTVILKEAVKSGNEILIGFIIGKGVNYFDEAFYAAARSGHRHLVDFFIDRGEDDWTGGLVEAALGGHLDLVKFFIEKGVDELEDALDAAASKGYLDIVKFLYKQGARHLGISLFMAAKGNHIDVVEYLIKKGGDPDIALQGAVESGNFDLIKALLERGGTEGLEGMDIDLKQAPKDLQEFFAPYIIN